MKNWASNSSTVPEILNGLPTDRSCIASHLGLIMSRRRVDSGGMYEMEWHWQATAFITGQMQISPFTRLTVLTSCRSKKFSVGSFREGLTKRTVLNVSGKW